MEKIYNLLIVYLKVIKKRKFIYLIFLKLIYWINDKK